MLLCPRHATASLLTLRIACVLALFLQTQCDLSADDQQPLRTILRRPIAMVHADQVLYVANRDTGSISVVDSASGVVLNEIVVSSRVDDLAILASSRTLLAVNSESHELIVLQMSQDADRVPGIRKIRSEKLAKYPVSIVSAPDGELASCVSKWSRRLTVIIASTLSFERTFKRFVDLPFVPLRQCFLNDRFVLVADAHGGELAIVDAAAGELISHQKLIGHNIRGLAVTDAFPGIVDNEPEPSVVITHQILNAASSTTRSIISWGGVISNTLHTIPIRQLLKSSSTQSAEPIHGSLFPLGREGQGAGDPSGVVIAKDGRSYVALRGVSEVAMRRPGSRTITRVPTGRGPTQLLLNEGRNRLFVLCTFDDSISEFDAESLELVRTIRLGPIVPVKSFVQSGEELFYDSRLSLDGWFSCHSCHSDGHSTGQLNDNFGDESFGTPKRILTLLGTGDTEPWAWNGSLIDLRNQIRKSIHLTMAGPGKQSPTIGEREIESLDSFLSSLPPAPGILTARDEADRPSVRRGQQVFASHGCTGCHQPPSFASPLSFDVGFRDEAGKRYFNPPSLLGVSQRGPYFHDNRAARLVDVLLEFDHADAASLPDTEIDDLVDFLKSL